MYEALPTDDPQARQPDTTLAEELLGWEPEVTLRDGLRGRSTRPAPRRSSEAVSGEQFRDIGRDGSLTS